MDLLTKKEQDFAADASVMLAKNKIIQWVYELFGRLAETYKTQTAILPADVIQLHPKISRGENYLGLPWVMLDFPRQFAGKDAFAIRTMFWWGYYFSLHLLLQGNKMQLLNPEKLKNAVGWHFSITTDPWQHQYDEQAAIPANTVTPVVFEEQAAHGFYKISLYLPLHQWDNAEAVLSKKFEEMVALIVSDSAVSYTAFPDN